MQENNSDGLKIRTKKSTAVLDVIRIGVICPSEIAFRRFLPALTQNELVNKTFCFAGVAVASPEEWFGDLSDVSQKQVESQQIKELEKARLFIDGYGGKVYHSYESIVKSEEIDAIYIPLPPALHYRWAKRALESGKHVMVEKPSTTCLRDTQHLIEIAKKNSLALHENYMFVFHNQIQAVNRIVADEKSVGIPWLYRITFGFPRRALTDFRYNKKLGGGALLDAGGYTMRYASELLGPTAKITTAQANYEPDFEVDVFGTATMVNADGVTAQLAFGMDNDYRCDIEVWGSKGTLTSGRILTAPVGYSPKCLLKQNQEYTEYELPEDDAFGKSLLRFAACINDERTRFENYDILERQESLVQQYKDMTGI